MRTRRGLTLVLSLLVAFAAWAASSTARAQDATPAAGASAGDFAGVVDVGGRGLYLTCAGEGSPTVVIDHGQFGSSADMAPLQRALNSDARVCLYDRAGQGQSDPSPDSGAEPRTAADAVADLHAVLEAAGISGPYVLVGHSAGGAFVQLFARTYPDEVAGVVAENAVPPADPWLDEAIALMTEEERAGELAYYAGGPGNEEFDFGASFAQLESAGPPPDVPFLVLISTIAQCESPDDICGRTYGVYEVAMRGVAEEWPRGRFLQLEGGHDLYLAPDAVEAIRSVVAASRDPDTWPMATTAALAATPTP